MSALFTPFKLKSVTLRNRIAVPAMCQYGAVYGFAGDWHQVHYPSIARGGAGLVIVEATAVSPEGRITPGCLGLWNDAQVEGLARIAAGIESTGAVAGIQLGHAGRKASANRPWEGDNHIPEWDPRAWQPLAPSAIAFGAHLPRVPKAMTLDDIARVKSDFVAAARRARDAGFKWLELHFAHGYLAQSFFSQRSNQRLDAYGGSFDNRVRFLLEILTDVRAAWPAHLPLAVRFGAMEYGGNDEEGLAESIELARRMRAAGLDFLNVSISAVAPGLNVPWGTDAFLAPVAEQIRSSTGLSVAAGWGIDNPHTAERVVADKQLDLVMVGRAHIANPHYPYHMALALGEPSPASTLPPVYAYWLAGYQRHGQCASLQARPLKSAPVHG